MPSPLEPGRSVGALATELPGAARVLDRLGIDFCCGGGLSLAAACAAKGLDLNQVLAELAAGAQAPGAALPDWQAQPLAVLMRHIVERHHQYVRTEAVRIRRWLDQVVAVHGARHPELARVRERFDALAGDLAQHMAKEELMLFPAIARLEAGAEPGATAGPASLAAPVRMMLMEHTHSGDDLAQLRQASADFTPPPDACTTYRALYRGLAEFDADLRQHIHLENNLLFPRALALQPGRAHAG